MIAGLNELYAALRGDGLSPEWVEPFKQALGRVIAKVSVADGEIVLMFADDTWLKFIDHASCCEHRYFTCPDDLQALVGARFMDLQQRDYHPSANPTAAPETEDSDGNCHDQSFLEIITDKGSITVTAHNEHNGYYGGFDLDMEFHGAGFSHSTED